MIVSLSFGKLGAGELDEARLGIDALRALMPLLQGQIEPRIMSRIWSRRWRIFNSPTQMQSCLGE